MQTLLRKEGTLEELSDQQRFRIERPVKQLAEVLICEKRERAIIRRRLPAACLSCVADHMSAASVAVRTARQQCEHW